jgi:hypothetical protein
MKTAEEVIKSVDYWSSVKYQLRPDAEPNVDEILVAEVRRLRAVLNNIVEIYELRLDLFPSHIEVAANLADRARLALIPAPDEAKWHYCGVPLPLAFKPR